MQPPLPSITSTWHNDTYDAISPLRAELSAKGKTVIVTGAGSGIGRETVLAFAAAGAGRLALLGRNRDALEKTSSLLPASIPATIHPVDVANESDLHEIAKSVGQWDVLILGAGYCPDPVPVVQSSSEDWWQGFETNVKGNFLPIKVFTPTANRDNATILALTTAATAMPVAMVPGLSAYMSSKLAQVKLIEYVAAENPHIFAATVHPGMVDTANFRKSGSDAAVLPMDTLQLPAHFMVWLSSPEARFLRGRSVWANWDVTELMAKAADIEGGILLTGGINGWPFTP